MTGATRFGDGDRRRSRRLPARRASLAGRALAVAVMLALALATNQERRPFALPQAPTASEAFTALTPAVITSPIRIAGAVVRGAVPDWTEKLKGRPRYGDPVPVSITAYCLKGTTRRGRYVRPGIVAADPKYFPLARYIEVYVGTRYLGRFLVDDTGGAIKGNRLDIWTPTCKEAVVFGRRRGTAVLVPHSEVAAAPLPTPDVANLMAVTRGERPPFAAESAAKR